MGKLTKDEVRTICREYVGGKNGYALAHQYGVTSQTVYYHLEKNNVARRPKSEAVRKYSLDQEIFGTITEKSSYWVGFLLADGCLSVGKRGKTVRLKLRSSDFQHLEKFRKFMDTDKPIYTGSGIRKGTECFWAKVVISSEKVFNDLLRYGLSPRKSLNRELIIHKLENNRHFWRGMVDGDGSLGIYGKRKNPRLSLYSGSSKLLQQFLDFLPENIARNGIYFSSNIFSIDYGCAPAKKIISLLYSDCSIYLDRKMKIAQEVMLHG